MRPLIGYIFLIALVETPLSTAKRVPTKKLKQCCAGNSTKNFCEFLELSCPPGYVIYKPDVYPTSASCKNGHVCHGVDIPYTDLRIDILNCYWKSKCLIDLSSIHRTLPFTSLETKCPTSEWQNVMVKDWKCVQKAVVLDICAGNKTHIINIAQRHNKPSGVVRSHERFPWEYNKDVFHIENNRYAPRCTVTLNGYLQYQKDFNRVAIYVASLDIGDDFNTAFIQNKELDQNMTYVHNFTSGPVNITFGFKVTDYNIKGGSGFVLYYKFLKVDETALSVKELEDVIQTKRGMDATCIHNHQYFCPFRKMCDKKKSKLFVPSNDSHNLCTYRSIKKPGKPKHCLKEEKPEICKVRKAAFKGRKWPMIINGNSKEKHFACKWMFKCKPGTIWNITLVSNSIDRRFDNFTVKHFRCEDSDLMTYTTLVPKITYTMDGGDVITVEYSRITDKEPDTWTPPNTNIKMTFERLRKKKGKHSGHS